MFAALQKSRKTSLKGKIFQIKKLEFCISFCCILICIIALYCVCIVVSVVHVRSPSTAPILASSPVPSISPIISSFSLLPSQQSEIDCYSRFINQQFINDSDLSHLLPIQYGNNNLFQKLSDGLIIAKLINKAVPYTIDERAMHKRTNEELTINWKQIMQNCNLVIAAAKSIGITMRQTKVTKSTSDEKINFEDNSSSSSFISSISRSVSSGSVYDINSASLQLMEVSDPKIIIDFIFQIMRIICTNHLQYNSNIQLQDLQNLPEVNNNSVLESYFQSTSTISGSQFFVSVEFLHRICFETMSIEELKSLAPELFILRWINYHFRNYLKNHQQQIDENQQLIHPITNFQQDCADGLTLQIILNQLSIEMNNNSSVDVLFSPPHSLSDCSTSIFHLFSSLSISHFHSETSILNDLDRLNFLTFALLHQHQQQWKQKNQINQGNTDMPLLQNQVLHITVCLNIRITFLCDFVSLLDIPIVSGSSSVDSSATVSVSSDDSEIAVILREEKMFKAFINAGDHQIHINDIKTECR